MSEKSLLVGGISGLFSQIITWPLEFIKTTKQLPKYKDERSILNVVRNEVKINGYKILFTGILPQVTSSIPRSSLRFYTFNKLNEILDNKDKKNNIKNFYTGIIAGGIEASVIMTPAEVIKVKSIKYCKESNLSIIKRIYKNQGLSGFYQGIYPTVLRQATTQGFSFLAFNYSKPRYLNYFKDDNISSFLAGLTGGCFAVFVNHPIDTIKTRIQSNKLKGNLLNDIKNMYQENGILRFYKGGLLRGLRVGTLHGITFLSYDFFKKIL